MRKIKRGEILHRTAEWSTNLPSTTHMLKLRAKARPRPRPVLQSDHTTSVNVPDLFTCAILPRALPILTSLRPLGEVSYWIFTFGPTNVQQQCHLSRQQMLEPFSIMSVDMIYTLGTSG